MNLIDLGSSHNFMLWEMVEKAKFYLLETRPNTILLLNDGIGTINCKVLQVLMRMQVVPIERDFEVWDGVQYDAISGTKWLPKVDVKVVR
jgi:hypothetical protein